MYSWTRSFLFKYVTSLTLAAVCLAAAENVPRVDLHVHLDAEAKGGKSVTPSEAAALSRKLGVRFGVLAEGGCGGDIRDDKTLEAFLQSMEGQRSEEHTSELQSPMYPLFPYTTLFRSPGSSACASACSPRAAAAATYATTRHWKRSCKAWKASPCGAGFRSTASGGPTASRRRASASWTTSPPMPSSFQMPAARMPAVAACGSGSPASPSPTRRTSWTGMSSSTCACWPSGYRSGPTLLSSPRA